MYIYMYIICSCHTMSCSSKNVFIPFCFVFLLTFSSHFLPPYLPPSLSPTLPISHPHRVTQLGSSLPSASHMETVLEDRRVATDVYLHHYCHKPVAGSELLHTHTQCLYRRTQRLANQVHVHVYTLYIHVHVHVHVCVHNVHKHVDVHVHIPY